MSVDLSAILDSVAPLIESVADTSGCTVDIVRPVTTTTDSVTLKVTTTDAPVGSDLAAIVTMDDVTSREDGPRRPRDLGVYLVKLTDLTVDARADDVVVFTAARDPLLQDARLVVRAVGFDGSGMLRVLRCERRRPDGG